MGRVEWWGTLIGLAMMGYAFAIATGKPWAARLRGGTAMSEGERTVFAVIFGLVGLLIVAAAWLIDVP